MSAVSQRIDAIGIVPQPCPGCETLSDELVCGVCGYNHVETARPKAAEPIAQVLTHEAPHSNYRISCYDSPICECGCEKVPMAGFLQCPECGDDVQLKHQTNQAPKQVAEVKHVVEREIIPPVCVHCAKDGVNETRFDIMDGEFVCECGESAGPVRIRGEVNATTTAEPKTPVAPESRPNTEQAATLPAEVKINPVPAIAQADGGKRKRR